MTDRYKIDGMGLKLDKGAAKAAPKTKAEPPKSHENEPKTDHKDKGK